MNAEGAPSTRADGGLLWADIRDMRRPRGMTVRGVRFLTCVELQVGTAFILEGRSEPASPRTFLAGSFVHALSQCRDWKLQEPKLFVYVGAKDHVGPAVLARITEVHGNRADGALILKFENGESMIIDPDSGPLPAGPLKRLFPPD
jgi:hypothetical protein